MYKSTKNPLHSFYWWKTSLGMRWAPPWIYAAACSSRRKKYVQMWELTKGGSVISNKYCSDQPRIQRCAKNKLEQLILFPMNHSSKHHQNHKCSRVHLDHRASLILTTARWCWWWSSRLIRHWNPKVCTVQSNCTFFKARESSDIKKIRITVSTFAAVCEFWCLVARAASTIRPKARVKDWWLVGFARIVWNRGWSFCAGKIQITIGNDAREEFEVISVVRRSLPPPRITFTFKKESAITWRLANSFSTFHFFTHIIQDWREDRRK